MSFRTRLTGFFVLIVILPMVAVGVLVFRLIGDSEQGKADARAGGLASAAASLYQNESASGRVDAQTLARALGHARGPGLVSDVRALAAHAGLARVTVRVEARTVADVGDRSAVAPGTATVSANRMTVTVSELTAGAYTHDLAASGVAVVVRQDGATLSATVPPAGHVALPRRGDVTIGGTDYRAVTQRFAGFGPTPVAVTVLSDLSATQSSVQTSQLVAAIFIAVFLLLALAFSVLAARELEGQLGRFLQAARRLGSGDFSSPVPTEGHDQFAALGEEFNKMSALLERRLAELQQERVRLRDSIHRIGQTFESSLDRPALLELALRTAVDAVQARGARLSVRQAQDEPLAQVGLVGSLDGVEQHVYEAEKAALSGRGLGEAQADEAFVAAVALGPIERGGRVCGLITVARNDRPYDDGDRDLLRSLAAQATLALENIELHFQVSKQAVTDELTGLANHGRFQELLQSEIEQVRRYHHPIGLMMLDLDDFKSINDTYGHQQGDVVLKHVAHVLRDTSREADTPARYGGEEMAVILPHTDIDGAYVISERLRSAIGSLRIPRIDGHGAIRITASFGVAASAEGDKDVLIADADAALYAAKREGKNRSVRARPQPAKVSAAE
jgi:diguanylate cyclase (GGDEF)-like protein